MQERAPKKKLIEVALPLEAINIASAREKSIRHGHPSTLHLWWARRPLATCRAVLFASLVDDPSSLPEQFPTEEAQDAERQRLFEIIEKLVLWENSANPEVLDAARAEIMKSTGGRPPPVLDPFCGGGSIPLEAQRLGLEAYGSDLNPVATLITKALIEIPRQFDGEPPVNPGYTGQLLQVRKGDEPGSRQLDAVQLDAASSVPTGGAFNHKTHSLFPLEWPGATGLAADVRYYGEWMRDEAKKRIGRLYPKAQLPAERGGGESVVIAWIWARTVQCPNPACGVRAPLVRSFELSKKPGKKAWIEPVLPSSSNSEISYTVLHGEGQPRKGTVDRLGAVCINCCMAFPLTYIRAEGRAKRMGAQLMAIVAQVKNGRVYLPPGEIKEGGHICHEQIAAQTKPDQVPNSILSTISQISPPKYGMTTHADLFTSRQLTALTTFSDLVIEARKKIRADILEYSAQQLLEEEQEEEGMCSGRLETAEERAREERADAYAGAVATYLAFAVSKLTDYNSSICTWHLLRENTRNVFSRQAIPMVWDFAENNPLEDAGGSMAGAVEWVTRVLDASPAGYKGVVENKSAEISAAQHKGFLFSTDPPYYDNVPYADLSDFFYVWLRRSLRDIYPDLFRTLLVPKSEELVADPFRYGGREKARFFFEEGMKKVFCKMRESAHPDYPVTIYYAYKQAEEEVGTPLAASSEGDEIGGKGRKSKGNRSHASTGWETFLQGLLDAGFQITATWPMRTELANRPNSQNANALASSIVLACRPLSDAAPSATYREFVAALRRELEAALLSMMHGNIAPVDLAQATIGPGIAVYSRYSSVLNMDGSPVRVRAALQIINQELDVLLSAQEGEYDADTRFCIAFFETFGMESAPYGDAETLSKARNASVGGLVERSMLEARLGRTRLLNRDEVGTLLAASSGLAASNWNPKTSENPSSWLCAQQIICALLEKGEEGAARLVAQLGSHAESVRDLAYRLYSISDRKGWAAEAVAYNSLVVAWPEISRLARSPGILAPQRELF